MTTDSVTQAVSVYVVPSPEVIMPKDIAVEYIKELEATPVGWVYVLTKFLNHKTLPEYIQWREGPQKKKVFYCDGAYAIATRAALSRIGIGSDFEVLDTKVEGEESASVLGRLTFKFVYSGIVLTSSSMQWGDCPKRTGMSWGDVKKGAATDSLKKCLSEFGWAADVYAMEPEKLPAAPTDAEAHAKSVEYVISAAAEKGISPTELTQYSKVHYNDKDVPDLDQVTLTALKRKIQSKEGLK